MREAPDAQVVLEIAAVRAVRPDLDSGMEALSERVSVLERSQSGAPAFPRPGAAMEQGVAAPSTATPSAASPSASAPEAPVVSRPPGEVARRPSIGAMRRSKEAAAPAPEATPPKTVPSETSVPSQTAVPPPTAEPDPVVATLVAPVPPVAVAGGAGGTLDRDSLTEAWGDGILQSLPARAKARYASGRFVAVDEEGAHFALPNAAHREQCAEQQSVVETALSEHFGTKVTLVLDIDDSGTPPGARPGPSPSASGRSAGGAAPAPAPPVEEVEYIDPSELIDDASPDQASAAEARLLQAFPGASEVAE
jgi:DNA polymerase III subunit gamma/tau